MRLLSLPVLCLLVATTAYGDDRPTVFSLAGREFSISDDTAGQELAFRKQGESLVALWRILGSGRPVISEIEYPVVRRSQWQIIFEVELRSKVRGKIKVSIVEHGEIQISVDGVRIPVEERPPR